MKILTVTEKPENETNLLYLQSTLSEVLTQVGCTPELKTVNGRAFLTFTLPLVYAEIMRAEITDRIAEVLAVGYKHEFFKKNLSVGGISQEEKEILIASLIAADLDEEKRYILKKLNFNEQIAIDGTFNFMLKPLRARWGELNALMPAVVTSELLLDFVTRLTQDARKNRTYIDNGRVYDRHYRRLKRAELLGYDGVKIAREVIMSNCGGVEINGEIDKKDEYYLKAIYEDEIYFAKKS